MQTIASSPIPTNQPREENRDASLLLARLALACMAIVLGGCCCPQSDMRLTWQSGTQPYYVGTHGLALALIGPWVHNDCPTNISAAPDGRSLTLTDDSGHQAIGYMIGNRELLVPSLGIRGHVGYGALHITWSDGSVWARPSAPWYGAVFP
jgi:hypothetical protein